MKRKLIQYSGALTSAQIAAGMNGAIRNATRLQQDAQRMLEADRYPTAVALSVLSIEESGKLRIFREMALARDNEELRSTWREYRQHTSKNQLWPFVESVAKGASKLGDFRRLVDPDSDHPHVLDQIKQISLYTDCLGNARWSVPEDVMERELATALVGVAKVLSASREVTPEEIELWIYYMRPAFRTTLEAMERALAEWDAEMRRRGLCSQDGHTMEEFIIHGFRAPKTH
jgi:AbiV family abortive infection protein